MRLFRFISLALILLLSAASCTDKDLSEPSKKSQYIKATIDGEEFAVYNEDGNIQKVQGQGQLVVQAWTKYDEGYDIRINKTTVPATYPLSLDDGTGLAAFIFIRASIFYPDQWAEFVSGEIHIEEMSQNPLVLKGTFHGRVRYSPTNSWSGPYDTVDVVNGVMNVEF